MASSRPGSSPSSRAEIAWRICMQVIRGSRPRRFEEFPSIVGRGGRADAAVPRRTRRRPHRPAARGARQPGRRVAPRPPPGGPGRRRRRHPGHVRARRGRRSRRSGATRAPAPGCSRSPAGRAPTRCAATVRRRRIADRAGASRPRAARRAGPSPIRAASTRSRRWSTSSPATSAPRSCSPRSSGARTWRRPRRAASRSGPSGHGSPGRASTWSRRCAASDTG